MFLAWGQGIFILIELSSTTLLTRQGWGFPTPKDLWQKVKKDSGDGFSVFCIVLLHGLKPCGKLSCVIILFPYGKCQDRSCSIRICSPWPLPAWLSNHIGFPSCLGLLYLGPACLTRLIALKPALLFIFFFPSHFSHGCFTSPSLFSHHRLSLDERTLTFIHIAL